MTMKFCPRKLHNALMALEMLFSKFTTVCLEWKLLSEYQDGEQTKRLVMVRLPVPVLLQQLFLTLVFALLSLLEGYTSPDRQNQVTYLLIEQWLIIQTSPAQAQLLHGITHIFPTK